MKLGNNIVQNMFRVPYPVLALEHLWVLLIIIQRLKMLAPIVHIQTTKGAQVLKLDMALQTCVRNSNSGQVQRGIKFFQLYRIYVTLHNSRLCAALLTDVLSF